jgi:hypothetical protein
MAWWRWILWLLLSGSLVQAAGAGPVSADEAQLFILWGMKDRWDGELQVEGCRLNQAHPFNFNRENGDQFQPLVDGRLSWQSSLKGRFAGVRLFADLTPNAVFVLRTPFGERRLKPGDFPTGAPRIVPIEKKKHFLVLGRGDPAFSSPAVPPPFPLPSLVQTPRPANPIPLPAGWWKNPQPLSVRFSEPTCGEVKARRVSQNDGKLYLQILCPQGPFRGRTVVSYGDAKLAERENPEVLWLSLEPRFGTLLLRLDDPSGQKEMTVPATLVETRGPKLYVNGEPFLIKGSYANWITDEDAAWLKDVSANTLRINSPIPQLEKYGFMTISIVGRGPSRICRYGVRAEEFPGKVEEYLQNLRKFAGPWMSHPSPLLFQLGNEQVFALDPFTGAVGINMFGRLDYLLARCHGEIKELCPMAVCSYSNHAVGYRAPSFLEVYAHNSYLSKDNSPPWPPLAEFSKWQGCDARPFVMSEWGSKNYMPELYRFSPTFPVLEKIQAWNVPNRWKEYLDAGVTGGTEFRLYDLSKKQGEDRLAEGNVDEGWGQFGIMTAERQPKLSMWELWHLYRDFELAPAGDGTGLTVRYRRECWARDCKLTLKAGAKQEVIGLADFAPNSERVVPLPKGMESRFHWRFDYTTHGGLPMAATGAQPADLEVQDFMERLKARDCYPFLRELFDAEVLPADGRSGVTTLADLEREDGLVTVAFRKPTGVVYVTAFNRIKPQVGWTYTGVSVDLAFSGKVEAVDPRTGEPLQTAVSTERLAKGVRLKNLRVPCLPREYGRRAKESIDLPVYRITP